MFGFRSARSKLLHVIKLSTTRTLLKLCSIQWGIQKFQCNRHREFLNERYFPYIVHLHHRLLQLLNAIRPMTPNNLKVKKNIANTRKTYFHKHIGKNQLAFFHIAILYFWTFHTKLGMFIPKRLTLM